jgi:uncharacterized protein (DUF58 family)
VAGRLLVLVLALVLVLLVLFLVSLLRKTKGRKQTQSSQHHSLTVSLPFCTNDRLQMKQQSHIESAGAIVQRSLYR